MIKLSPPYNKWYVHWDSDRILFKPSSKKYKVLARMVVKEGSKYSEVELEKGGKWGTRVVYCMKHMSEIVSMEEILSDLAFSWQSCGASRGNMMCWCWAFEKIKISFCCCLR